jgi:hypothetical protein
VKSDFFRRLHHTRLGKEQTDPLARICIGKATVNPNTDALSFDVISGVNHEFVSRYLADATHATQTSSTVSPVKAKAATNIMQSGPTAGGAAQSVVSDDAKQTIESWLNTHPTVKDSKTLLWELDLALRRLESEQDVKPLTSDSHTLKAKVDQSWFGPPLSGRGTVTITPSIASTTQLERVG